jgi:hypothetical protein
MSFSMVRMLSARASVSAARLYSSRSERMVSSLQRSSVFCSWSAAWLAAMPLWALLVGGDVPFDACLDGQGDDGEFPVGAWGCAVEEAVHRSLDLAALILLGHRLLALWCGRSCHISVLIVTTAGSPDASLATFAGTGFCPTNRD